VRRGSRRARVGRRGIDGILDAMRLELTRRGDYAVRAAVALARANGRGQLTTRKIAAEMSIPPRFLPQVMADLVRAGIAVAQPGRSGGYRLAQPADGITLLRVIRAAEGGTKPAECVLRGGPCDVDGRCDVHEVIVGARGAMLEVLGAATLQSIVESTASGRSPGIEVPSTAP